MDLPQIYGEAQARTSDLVGSLDAERAARVVPGTPEWQVTDLLAHLAGVTADVASGNLEGVATPPWTAKQVADRKGHTIDELLAEWKAGGPLIMRALETPGLADPAAIDALTHEHDLRGALDVAGASDPEAVRTVLDRLAGFRTTVIEEAGLPALRLVGDDGEWTFGTGAPAVTGTAPTVQWFRAVMGRRTAEQVLTYDWAGDPSPYFGLLSLFGPLPTGRVAEAGAP